MKPERVQIRFMPLDGWVQQMEASQGLVGQEEPVGIWTAFELADHLEACELVREIGEIADINCVAPEIDVRGNVLFVTAKTDGVLTEADFDFAEAIDRELGTGQRQKTLLDR